MKNNFLKLNRIVLFSILSFIIFQINVDALNLSGCRFDSGDVSYPVNDYPLYVQKLTCGGKTYEAYCIDAGYPNPHSTSGTTASIINSPGLSTVFSQGSYFENQVALRVWASNAGLTHSYKPIMKKIINGTISSNPTFVNAYNIGKGANSSYTLSGTIGSDLLNLTVLNVNKASQTAEIMVSALTNINLASIDWSVISGASSVSKSGDGQKLIVSGFNVGNCKGAKVKLKATIKNSGTSTTGTPGTPGTPGTTGTGPEEKYILVHYSNQQSMIVRIPSTEPIPGTPGTPGTPDTPGTPGNNTPGSSNSYTFEVTIPDPDCDCSGESNLCQECRQDGESSDNKEYAKNCANNDSFKEYAGVSLKKNENIDTDTSIIASHSGSSVAPSKNLASNEYCNVYCLEDIKYTMPGKLKTKNGRYFKLKTGFDLGVNEDGQNISITGTRSCITSEIQTKKFITNLLGSEASVVQAKNNYELEKAKKEANKLPYKCEEKKKWNCDESKTVKGKCASDNKTDRKEICDYTSCKKDPVKYKIYTASFDSSTGNVISITEGEGEYNAPEKQGSCEAKDEKGNYLPKYKTTEKDEKGNDVTVYKDFTISDSEKGDPDGAASAISAKLEIMYKYIDKYKSCFEWTNNYCFSPKAKFNYNEVYTEATGEIPMKGTVKKGDQSEYYYVDVDSSYEGSSSTLNKKSYNYIYASKDTIDSSNISSIDLTTKYVKKVVTSSATFEDGTIDVYSYHPYGTIIFNSCTTKNCVSLGKVLPVALQHDPESDAYEYNITFEDVGVAGNDADCSVQPNRINGRKDSLTAIESGCESDYSCYYETASCPDCKVECVCPDNKPNCYVEDKICKYKVCDNCIVECIGCVVDRGNTKISYKTISLNDVYQDDTQIASNWTLEDIEEIEKEGQKIYDKEPQYSFILTPQTMSKIREYNEISASNKANNQNIPRGGYNNDTLTCTIKETNTINCKSSFLRVYLEKNAKNAIRISPPESWDE